MSTSRNLHAGEQAAPLPRRSGVMRALVRTMLGATLLSALLLAVMRFTLPGVSNYREEVAAWIGESLGHRVEIGSLEAGWRGWIPELWVEDVRLVAAGDDGLEPRTLARFEQATISLDPIATLEAGRLIPGEMMVSGAALAIYRDAGGELRIDGLPAAERADDGGSDMASWVLAQARLRLVSTDITWRYGSGQSALRLRDVTLDLRNQGEHHHLELSLRLPGARAGSIGVSADVDGDLLTAAWDGEVTVTGDDVDLAVLAELADASGVPATSGRARLRLRTSWLGGALDGVSSEFEISGLRLGSGTGRIPLASGKATAVRVGAGWDGAVSDLTITSAAGVWPRTQMQFAVRDDLAAGDGASRIEGLVGFARIEDLLPAAAGALAAGPWAERITRAAPAGELRNLRFELLRRPGAQDVVTFEGEFSGLSSQPVDGLPGVTGATGALVLADGSGSLVLRSATLEGTLPNAPDTAIQVDDVSGSVRWARGAEGLEVQAQALRVENPDLSLRIDGLARIGESGPPFVDGEMAIEHARLESLNAYLPHASMPKGLSRWLRLALDSGQLVDGRVRLRGPLGRALFSDADAALEADVRVESGRFAYARGWPELDAIGGTVSIRGKRLQFDVDQAEIYDSTIPSATVVIPDLGKKVPLVLVKGVVDGVTEDTARYLRESVIGPRFRHFLNSVTATGESRLSLDLAIPAKKGARQKEKRVDGVLEVKDNVVALPGMSEGLQAVHGSFAFSGDRVTADGVRATYLSRPIDLSAHRMKRRRATRLTVTGEADAAYLAAHLHNTGLLRSADPSAWALTARLDGESTWRATVDVPHVITKGAPRARVRVESSLEGLSSSLPHPFDKSATRPGPVRVETRFEANGDRLMRFEFDDDASAVLLLKPGLGRYRIHNGTIRFGGGEASLPEREGIVVRGALERLSVADWLQINSGTPPASPGQATPGKGGHPGLAGDASAGLSDGALPAARVAATAAPPGTAEEPRSIVEHFREVDLAVDDLEVAGLNFDDADMTGERDQSGTWQIAVEGPQVSGRVRIPRNVRNRGIEATFERVVFIPDEEARRAAAPDAVDPRSLPPMRFTCRDCRYKDEPIGIIEASTSVIPEGVRIDSLIIRTPHASIRATGTWTSEGGQQNSRLDARGAATDLGALVDQYSEETPPTAGGEMEVLLNAAWPGSPGAFELSRVAGVLQMRARDGRLLNIQPGAASRLMGLLTVSELPRRLRLDFSDLTEEGFAYSEAGGTFTIADGNAFTDDLFIDSQVARIEIRGRTGLEAQDYDQVIKVTPKLTSSIPFAPIWLAERMLNRELFNRAFAVEYTVTGSWEEPAIEKVIVPSVSVDGD